MKFIFIFLSLFLSNSYAMDLPGDGGVGGKEAIDYNKTNILRLAEDRKWLLKHYQEHMDSDVFVDMSGYNLNDSDLKPLAKALKKAKKIKTLDLSCNGFITDKGALTLAKALLRNKTLTTLNLDSCAIGLDGILLLGGVIMMKGFSLTITGLGEQFEGKSPPR